MGLGVGIFLIAVGAILTFAIHVGVTNGVDIHTIGWILMAVGGLGVLLSLVFWSSWMGPGRGHSHYAGGPPPAGPPVAGPPVY
ncbi:MAG: hypothetical protein JOY80_07605 [Candidatus Dormibacteraeota bacterium]|nr:hypothetical protein [Candidatus Dormibacteraeota bacterium]